MHTLLEHWSWLQYLCLLLAGALLVGVERRLPRRVGQPDARARWIVNLGLYATGGVLMALAFAPLQAAAIRLGAATGWGGLAAMSWPDALKIALGVVLVDLIQYALHRLCHAIPLMWRLHQVHHADEGFDVSTSVRHHPLEVMALAALTLMACAALGVPLLSLLLYVALQFVHTLFCHANIALSANTDRWLRWAVVTPDMHRVHHSACLEEGNRNFSMVFSWWDRWFRTYCAQPVLGHQAMRLGLADPADQGGERGLGHALRQPFRTVHTHLMRSRTR